MPITIKVNGTANSLVHKMSNGISIATIPDVCKTPSPAGPVPIPYPNIAQSITVSSGTTNVKGDKMMAANKGSKFALSNGDNAGVAGGVKSSTFMKEATWILYSFDVKLQKKNASRFTDKMFHNSENAANLAGELQALVDAGAITQQEKDAICDAFCQAQREHLDPKNKTVKGRGSASRRFEDLLAKKLKQPPGIPGARSELSYWMPPGGGTPTVLTQALFNRLAGGLAASRAFNLIKGLIGPAARSAPVVAGAGVLLSRAMGLAGRLGRVVRPDLVILGRGKPIVMDAKFDFYSGGRDKFTEKQLRNYRRVAQGRKNCPAEINGAECGCPGGVVSK
jgi:hypothetical protein